MLCAILLSFAASLAGYDTPDDCPRFVDVSKEWMLTHAHVPALGWYPQERDKIYLDGDSLKRVSMVVRKSIIVHEMVHYLDWLNGKLDRHSTCKERAASERRAYNVQNQYVYLVTATKLAGLRSLVLTCK